MTNDTISVPFVNNGEPFDLPIIKVSDIRALQRTRAHTTEGEVKELESSIALVKSVLKRVDNKITDEQIETWDYHEFMEFVQKLWEKNSKNFRGILPKLGANKK